MSDARRYSVLLADDVAALRRLVRIAIERSGRFQVVAEASNGLEAIARAKDSKPDLVLLDLSMPEMDGLEALPHVLSAAPSTHVVVLSGFNHLRMEPVARRAGASAYLEKGLEPEQLVQALLKIIEPEGARVAIPGESLGGPPLSQADDEPHVLAAAAALQSPTGAAPSSFRVLLVALDDAKADRIGTLLQQTTGATFSAIRTASVAGASKSLATEHVDVILVDPSQTRAASGSTEDGLIELLGSASKTPVVALIPGGDLNMAARALRLGVEDCVDLIGLDAHILARSLLYAMERRHAHESRRVVRDQENQLQRMREMEALKIQFFNAAAHEMSTPLTPIRLQVALLKNITKDHGDVAEQHSIEILERNVQRLARLNRDILDVARLQAGRLPLTKGNMGMHELLREVVDTFEPMAREAGIGLTAICPPGLAVGADRGRILQVLYNLVSNALKFTPNGGVIGIEARAQGHDCQVLVRDSGVGLRPEQIARLFQPFSQVLGSDQPPGVGTGLGLFVSRGIVDLHGGRMWCTSEGPGRGSTFFVQLPGVSTHDVGEQAAAVAG